MSHAPNSHDFNVPGVKHEAVPLDPENDIDAGQAAKWFVGSAVVLFLSLWALVPIFMRVLEAERTQTIELVPNTELNDVKDSEMEFLGGANPTKKNLKTVLEQLRK